MKTDESATTAPENAGDIRCFCCKRPGWHRATFDDVTVRSLPCCLGPGEPWLREQSAEERATFVDRTIGAFRAADHWARRRARKHTE